MIQRQARSEGGGVVMVHCDTCIAGFFWDAWQADQKPPTEDALKERAQLLTWDVSTPKWRCPQCVAEGWTEAIKRA